MPRNAHQDALDEKEFERLLDATTDLMEPYDAECRLILLLGGRLGMRAGEITHIREEWMNWRKEHIRIPSYDRYDLGREGERYGYCRKQARQAARKNDDVKYEEALADRWSPKTRQSVRTIPIGFDDRISETLEGFGFPLDVNLTIDDRQLTADSTTRRDIATASTFCRSSLNQHALDASGRSHSRERPRAGRRLATDRRTLAARLR